MSFEHVESTSAWGSLQVEHTTRASPQHRAQRILPVQKRKSIVRCRRERHNSSRGGFAHRAQRQFLVPVELSSTRRIVSL